MSQLIQLKQRIKAIATIKKITQTMRLISMSTHSKLKKQADSIKNLKEELKPLLCVLTSQQESVFANTIQQTPKYKKLYIIFAAEKGLCGTFNTTMYSYFNNYLTIKNLENSHIISVGKKATNYLLQRGITPLYDFDKVLPNRLDTIAQLLYKKILLLHQDYEQVVCLSSFAKTFFIQEARTTVLIPVQPDPCTIADSKNINLDDYAWIQNQPEVTSSLFRMLLKINILLLLTNSMLSEQSARFLSMDNSTRNAENLHKSMKLAFNKMRQAKITRELIELISSF
ncbi:F0F1 ATP synthase subunit gamma [Candidatus Dependentiae bacterium]|nr:F0F1 ATP synthase subunit gamma [Candidatus Dependentiae bacterium]